MKSIKSTELCKMIINGARLIEVNKEHVDSLNVFPVPDGDTGTNMSLTMASCAKEVSLCQDNKMDTICDALAKGALKGARGNSGVILSQILKGIANTLFQAKSITVKNLVKAFKVGTEVSYKAVTKPQEGTMLTVMRAMSEAAEPIAKKTDRLDAFLDKVMQAGEEMLKKTPEMLPVLKKAGVVDAGGRGLLLIFKGFYNALIGKEEVTMEFDDRYGSDVKFNEEAHFDFSDLAEIEFAYCTEFFVINLKETVTEKDIDALRDKLMTIGDSVLAIGDLSLVKVHVHTNEPGTALTYALELGEVDKIKIDNMLEQNRVLVGNQKETLKQYGVVAISAGEGLSNIFKDLLVDTVVEGGQTMNPCADQIAKACDKIAAKDIFVFPNNKNIILAAQQAKALSKRNIHVVETKNIPQGLSAIINFDENASVEENLKSFNEAIQAVKTGTVTYAVRKAKIDKFSLKEGDIIGLSGSNIVAKGEDPNKVCEQVIEKLVDSTSGNISLYYGNSITKEQAESLAKTLTQKYPRCDIDTHQGGQPLYYYIIGVE